MKTNALVEMVAEGISKGRVEGRAEGEVEGTRAALRTLVTLKFGAIPPVLEERIAATDGESLDALFARAVQVTHVEEI